LSRFGRVLVATGTAAVIVAVVVGCTETAAGNPGPTSGGGEPSGSGPPSAEEPDRNGAPSVSDPLDADRFIADPCAALTQEQVAGFGFTGPGTPQTEGAIAEQTGPGCIWQGTAEEVGTIGVTYLTGNENGLADIYGTQDRYEYFIETTVSGYPAVVSDTVDARGSGACGISVGVSNSLVVRVLEQGDLDPVGACERVEQVAAAVVETMQGG
jgi:hypothetical protein